MSFNHPSEIPAASPHSGRWRLQQQPAPAVSDRQQQQSSGSGEFQPQRKAQTGQQGSVAESAWRQHGQPGQQG